MVSQDDLNQIWSAIGFSPGRPVRGWAGNTINGPQLSHKEHGIYEQDDAGIWHRVIEVDVDKTS